jgi:hypothetical protein
LEKITDEEAERAAEAVEEAETAAEAVEEAERAAAAAANNTGSNNLASKANNLSLASNINELIKKNPYLNKGGIIESKLVDAFRAFKTFIIKSNNNNTQKISNNQIMNEFITKLTRYTEKLVIKIKNYK